jgi:hypothetical protein
MEAIEISMILQKQKTYKLGAAQRYENSIRKLVNPLDLLVLWDDIVEDKVEDFWPDGLAFEYLILRSFEIEGAEVAWPYITKGRNSNNAIEQTDGVIYTAGISCIVESKETRNAINYEPIAKLRSKLMRRPSSVIGSIFSIKGFTSACLQLAEYNMPQTILMWEGEEIRTAIEDGEFTRKLILKYRNFVQHGVQDINTDYTKP